jgi:hypothetical protein
MSLTAAGQHRNPAISLCVVSSRGQRSLSTSSLVETRERSVVSPGFLTEQRGQEIQLGTYQPVFV